MSQPRFRIVHLVSGDAWGGLEAVVVNMLSSEIYRSRTDSTIIALNEGVLASRARARGLRVLIVPESAMSFISLAKVLKRMVEELKPDFVHTHRYKEILLGAILSSGRAPRHVITIHGYEPPPGLIARLKSLVGNSLCVGAAIARGGQFIVVADHLRTCFRIPRRRCVTIHNGIRIPDGVPRDVERRGQDHSASAVIGWVGRMVPVKGLSILLNAVAEMAWTPPPVLLLVGDGPERASLEMLARSLGISERVRFEGFAEDPLQFYSQMDLFALPSLHEGIPIALLEALGAGLPVVASSVGGIPQVMGPSGAGVLIDSPSPSVWARALTELLQDRSRMDALGKRARRHIQTSFSVDAMAGRYVALYDSLNAR